MRSESTESDRVVGQSVRVKCGPNCRQYMTYKYIYI